MNLENEAGKSDTTGHPVGILFGATEATESAEADFEAKLAQARLLRAAALARSAERGPTVPRNVRGMERRIEAARAERSSRVGRDPDAGNRDRTFLPDRPSAILGTLRSATIAGAATVKSDKQPSERRKRTWRPVAFVLVAVSVLALVAIPTIGSFRSEPGAVVTRARSGAQRLSGAAAPATATADLTPFSGVGLPDAGMVPERPVASQAGSAPVARAVWTDAVAISGSVSRVAMSAPEDRTVVPDPGGAPRAFTTTALRPAGLANIDVRADMMVMRDPAMAVASMPATLDPAGDAVGQVRFAMFQSPPPAPSLAQRRMDAPGPLLTDTVAPLKAGDNPRLNVGTPPRLSRDVEFPSPAPRRTAPLAVVAGMPVPLQPRSASVDGIPFVTALAGNGSPMPSPVSIGSQVRDVASACPLTGSCASGAALPALALIVSDGGDLAGIERMLGELGLDEAKTLPASLAVRRGQVRYFREADAALAGTLADKAGYDLLDLTWYRPQPSTATIEMRIPGPGVEG